MFPSATSFCRGVGEGGLLRCLGGGAVVDDPTASPVAQMVTLFESQGSEAVLPEAVSLRYLRAPDAKLPNATMATHAAANHRVVPSASTCPTLGSAAP